MTNPVELPQDMSFVKITDGTNSAIITNLDNSVGVYIGSTAPTADSTIHLLQDTELTVSPPAVVYLRSTRKGAAGKRVIVSVW